MTDPGPFPVDALTPDVIAELSPIERRRYWLLLTRQQIATATSDVDEVLATADLSDVHHFQLRLSIRTMRKLQEEVEEEFRATYDA